MSGAMEGVSGTDDDPWSRTCRNLLMHPSAAPGWRFISNNPGHAMWTYLTSACLALLMFAVIFIGGYPEPRFHALFPHAILSASGVISTCGMYRFGPTFAASRIGRATSGVVVLTVCIMSTMCFLGPPQFVPFNSKAITSILLLVAFVFLGISGEVGGVAVKHPSVPYASLKVPALRAARDGVRGLNTVSDFAVARLMFLQAAEPSCFWFGEPSSCDKYQVMAAVTTSLATTAVASVLVLSHTPSKFKESSRGRRMMFGASVLGLICDMGALAATFLKLYSDKATARQLDSDTDALADLEQEIAFAYVSCALSIMSFAVSSVGIKNVYAGMQQAVLRSSAAMRTNMARIASASPAKKAGAHAQPLQPDVAHTSVRVVEAGADSKDGDRTRFSCRHELSAQLPSVAPVAPQPSRTQADPQPV